MGSSTRANQGSDVSQRSGAQPQYSNGGRTTSYGQSAIDRYVADPNSPYAPTVGSGGQVYGSRASSSAGQKATSDFNRTFYGRR